MRETHIPQRSIFEVYGEHETAQQLKAISVCLDAHPEILIRAAEDLIAPGKQHTGRRGLTVDSLVRAAILKQMMALSYEELSFYLADSISYSTFARLEGLVPSSSTLHSGISRLTAQAWAFINRVLLRSAEQKGIEKGRMARIDSTVTATDIHPPSDSSLLWDSVRTMVRQLAQLQQAAGDTSVRFCNHSRSAKKKARLIEFSRGAPKERLYRALLHLTERTWGYLKQVTLQPIPPRASLVYPNLLEEAKTLLTLSEQVMAQTRRRVFQGEKVPSTEKVVSLFEPHTDIIVKGRRDVQYGHKLNFTTGKSGLVLDVVIEKGNPADSARFTPMLARQKAIYGRVPRQVAADGAYASQENLACAKAMGVKDVAFNKKRGLKVEDMTQSEWLYKKLTRFRAGIEGNISCLKRRYGLARCTWKGWDKFNSYIWASTVAYNLLLLARRATT